MQVIQCKFEIFVGWLIQRWLDFEKGSNHNKNVQSYRRGNGGSQISPKKFATIEDMKLTYNV